MRRIIYFFYYLKETDYKRFGLFLNYARLNSGHSKFYLIMDSILSCFYYNISLLDYFYFRFYEQDKYNRSKWAGTGFMYEYQKIMNPQKSRHLLENKIEFLNHFHQYVERSFADLKSLKENSDLMNKLILNKYGALVIKRSKGQAGADIEVINCKDVTVETLIAIMEKGNFDLVEEYVIQHPDFMRLSHSGLNTVRIITQLNGGRVDLLGARLRVTINSQVDNLAAGNIAAPVDINTGVVIGPGVFSDIRKKEVAIHPTTNIRIEGFKIPFWVETIDMIKNAALFSSENKSVGWDIAITEKGPELIEGNHNWCKLLWQLPVRQGLKHQLEYYLKQNKQ